VPHLRDGIIVAKVGSFSRQRKSQHRPTETGNPKNKIEKSGKFIGSQNRPLTHHIYHAIHHKNTTLSPQEKHHFSQNTPQKHQQNREKPPLQPSYFF
jgi:hypothetical protein